MNTENPAANRLKELESGIHDVIEGMNSCRHEVPTPLLKKARLELSDELKHPQPNMSAEERTELLLAKLKDTVQVLNLVLKTSSSIKLNQTHKNAVDLFNKFTEPSNR